MTELLHAELTYQLRGLGFRVHNELRGGHPEEVYEAALRIALENAHIPFQQQPVFHVSYRGRQVGEYRPDFVLADGKVLVELKATPEIEPLHRAQTIAYLAVTGAELGVVLNFGSERLQVERFPNLLERRQPEESYLSMPDSATMLHPEVVKATLDAMGYVHRTLGPGFLHQVYRRSAIVELQQRGIGHAYLKELPIRFDGHVIKMAPVRLLLVDNKLLLATVAMRAISVREMERMRWSTQSIGAHLGLIINFHGTQIDPHFVKGRG